MTAFGEEVGRTKQPTQNASLEDYKNQLMYSIRLKSVIIWLNCFPINNTNCQVSFPNNLGALPEHKRKDTIKPVCANFIVFLQTVIKVSGKAKQEGSQPSMHFPFKLGRKIPLPKSLPYQGNVRIYEHMYGWTGTFKSVCFYSLFKRKSSQAIL